MRFQFLRAHMFLLHFQIQVYCFSNLQNARHPFGLLPAQTSKEPSNAPYPNHSRLNQGNKPDYPAPYQPQQTLHLQAEDHDEFNGGTIRMLSTAGHFVPVEFTLSSDISALGIDTLLLAHELASWMLFSHPNGVAPQEANRAIQETVKLQDRPGVEYRASLSLIVRGELDEGPFLGLVKLLVRTTEALFTHTEERGLGILMQRAEFEGIEFEAWWEWYEAVDGDERERRVRPEITLSALV